MRCRDLNVLIWNVDSAWTMSIAQGHHLYFVPEQFTAESAERGTPSSPVATVGHGRAWPTSVSFVAAQQLRDIPIDVVILQRIVELQLVEQWLGMRPGYDVPAVFLEHSPPPEAPGSAVHPLADQTRIPIIHVSHFNQLMWDCGRASTVVIGFGAPDPGSLYQGDLNRPVAVYPRDELSARAAGLDLLSGLSAPAPIDVYGLEPEQLPQNVTGRVRAQPTVIASSDGGIARHRVYLQTLRWPALPVQLIEALLLGMPVVAVATGAIASVLPQGVGVISADADRLVSGISRFTHDHELARLTGATARLWATGEFGIDRFLAAWDEVFAEIADLGVRGRAVRGTL